MYINYDTFTKLFPNVEIAEADFSIYERIAESAAWNYMGEQAARVYPEVQHAVGLIIQKMYADGLRRKDLPQNLSEGGVSITFAKENDIITDEAKNILNRYREWTI